MPTSRYESYSDDGKEVVDELRYLERIEGLRTVKEQLETITLTGISKARFNKQN